jgi:hypothetical protein
MKATRKKRKRPEEVKDRMISIRFTDAELRELEACAQQHQMSVGEVVRLRLRLSHDIQELEARIADADLAAHHTIFVDRRMSEATDIDELKLRLAMLDDFLKLCRRAQDAIRQREQLYQHLKDAFGEVMQRLNP